MVAFDRCTLIDLQHLHPGFGLQDLFDIAFMLRRQMHDDHESHACVAWQRLEETRLGVDSTGGSTDPHDEKRERTGDETQCWRRELQNRIFVIHGGKPVCHLIKPCGAYPLPTVLLYF